MEFYYYRVQFETRWDNLAQAAYGNAYLMDKLLDANQEIALWQWLPVGVLIACPIILDDEVTNPADTLPAWKQ